MNDDGGDGRERVLVDLGPAVAPMLLAVVGVEILRGATVLLLPALVEVSIVISVIIVFLQTSIVVLGRD